MKQGDRGGGGIPLEEKTEGESEEHVLGELNPPKNFKIPRRSQGIANWVVLGHPHDCS
jgi:hypothetical protein